MRLIKVNVPEGYGRSVMETAFSVKIAKVTIHNAENHLPNGNVEPREIIDIEASTPKAKRFMDRMLQSDYFDRQRFSVAVRQTRSIVSEESYDELRLPLVSPITDIFEELFQFSHLTLGFLGRALISGCLLAYGLIQQQILLMIAGLLFLPLLPLLLAIGFGFWTRRWKLALQGFMTFSCAIVALLAAGIFVGVISGPPVRYTEFNSLAVGLLISLGVGIAAGLSTIDDVARRELIGLAATAQVAIIPAWFGVCIVLGFPETVSSTEISQRLLSFGANTVTIIVASLAVYLFTCGKASLKEKNTQSEKSPMRQTDYKHAASRIG